MSRLPVLQSFQTTLRTAFDRVYIYPEEYSDVGNDPDLPFFAIEELPAVENNTVFAAADFYPVEWRVGIYGYLAIGEFPAPGPEDAAAKQATYAARNTIRGLLNANMRPLGTLRTIGDEQRLYTDYIVRLQWNTETYMGCYFEIPVSS